MGYLYTTGWERGSLTDEGGASTVGGGGSAVQLNTSAPHTGTSCLEVVAASTAGRTEWAVVAQSAYGTMSAPKIGGSDPPTQTQFGCAVWIRFSAFPSATNTPVIHGLSNLGNNDEIIVGTSGQIGLAVEGSEASGVSIGTLILNQWHLVEFLFRRDGSSWRMQGRLDGGTTQQLTSPTDSNPLAGVAFGRHPSASTTTFTCQYDDFVFTDTLSMPGDHRVSMIVPDAGASDLDTNWSINGGSANRMAATDDDPVSTTTNIQSSTANQTQRLEMEDSSTLPAFTTIKCVDVRGYSQGVGGASLHNVRVQSGGGTNGAGVNWTYASGTFRYQPYQTNADCVSDVPGGTGWSSTEFDAFRVMLTKDNNANTVQVSDVWVYVAYTPGVPPPPLDHQFPGDRYALKQNAGWV